MAISKSISNDIDFVITWVDGNDPAWQAQKRACEKVRDLAKQQEQEGYQAIWAAACASAERQTRLSGTEGNISGEKSHALNGQGFASEEPRYRKNVPGHPAALTEQPVEQDTYTSVIRYRDWDNLRYWFRAVEQYAPWVRRIFFVTWGHLPAWLNTGNPRLRIVNHQDFIPAAFLPTFNTNAIELNLYRIPGLSEQFVYFNDDTFLAGPVSPDDFFRDGLPRDAAILHPYTISSGGVAPIEINNIDLLNKHFSTADVRKNKDKWVHPLYGYRNLLTLYNMRKKNIVGVLEPHLPLSFLKSSFAAVWDGEGKALEETCCHRFRSRTDHSDWLIRQWQLMEGHFVPRRWDFGRPFYLPQDLATALSVIHNPGKYRVMCLNDSPAVTDFEAVKNKINKAFQERYPEKSSFEW